MKYKLVIFVCVCQGALHKKHKREFSGSFTLHSQYLESWTKTKACSGKLKFKIASNLGGSMGFHL